MQNLAGDFEFADVNVWEQQALRDIGQENFKQLTQTKLFEEITQSPYADFTSKSDIALAMSYRNCTFNSNQKLDARHWLNMERFDGINPQDLNQLILPAISGGADGVILKEVNLSHLKRLREHISQADCYLGIEEPLDSIIKIDQWLRSSEFNLRGFYGIRKLANCLVDQRQQMIDLLSQSEFRVLVIKSDQQTGVLEKIALLLSQTIFIINQLLDAGVPLATIVSHIQISLEIGSGYLFEICRLRCLRYLFHQVVLAFGLTDFEAGSLNIQAVTTGIQSGGNPSSEETLDSTKDQNQKLISNTTQSMSAILGGCNILTIMPHLNGFNCLEKTPRRIARNIGHILKQESNLHKVADPVAGAYYLESLTTKISRAVWSRLQELESKGGYSTHLNSTV